MILTYCDALEVGHGRVAVRDTVGDRRFEIATTNVVNATGVWADGLAPDVHLAPSKGSHVIVRGSSLGNVRASVVVPIAGESARWVGATPTHDGHVVVGVTDEPYDGPPGTPPTVTAAEERYLLDALSRALEVPLDHSDVIGSYAGLRPLLSAGGESTRDLSRRHAIVEDARTGMVTVVGGKLTTYRRMAQDTVDRVLGGTGPRSVTSRLPLVGAAPLPVLRGLNAPERLIRRYGIEAPAVAALAEGDPTLLDPLAPGVTALGVEILFGLGHEGALTLDDLLDRRVRLGLVPAERDAAEAAAAKLAA
jgi:glycerol-3-phosphate dehydrogenase